jgi:hypothetical protein
MTSASHPLGAVAVALAALLGVHLMRAGPETRPVELGRRARKR